MTFYPIKCEAIEVRTKSNICTGMAKTEKGEQYVLDGRTPKSRGICSSAFGALRPMAFAMMLSEKMDWEQKDYFDIVCPHGVVTFRLSRVKGKRIEHK